MEVITHDHQPHQQDFFDALSYSNNDKFREEFESARKKKIQFVTNGLGKMVLRNGDQTDT